MRRYLVVLITVLGFAIGPAQATQRSDFWDWFQDNTEFLTQYDSKAGAVTRALGGRLQIVDRGLTFALGRAPDGVYEFIVSANGNRDAFQQVLKLVDAAPAIAGWRIIAFRPRSPDPGALSLAFGDVTLSADDIWYRAEDDGAKVSLELFLRDLSAENEAIMSRAGFVLLDNVLGEYDVATKLGTIGFAALPPDPAAAGLKPLGALPADVDARIAPTRQ